MYINMPTIPEIGNTNYIYHAFYKVPNIMKNINFNCKILTVAHRKIIFTIMKNKDKPQFVIFYLINVV